MQASTIFLDANVLLEILLDRPNAIQARRILESHSKSLCISALTAHLVVHFGQKIVDLPIIRNFLSDYSVLSLESNDFEWAFINSRNNDFEDALQMAVAIRNGCEKFVTFDKNLTSAYKNLATINVTHVNSLQ